MNYLQVLKEIRQKMGAPKTVGVRDDIILEMLSSDLDLQSAILKAELEFSQITQNFPELIGKDENEILEKCASGILNFYSSAAIAPYVPMVAKGSWIITLYGAVVFDMGGYGMLGLGHNPEGLAEVLAKDQVMANVMTRSLSQYNLNKKLREHIGVKLKYCPYDKFLFMNSGSEAMAVATRICDINAKNQLKDRSNTKYLAFKNGFHGRTYQPALASDSCRSAYQNLASFPSNDKLITIEPNNIDQLRNIFIRSKKENFFIEAFLFEPVMGEGNPGFSINPEFYSEARKLCTEHNTFMIADSIQAGLRGYGYLSVVDYPGFEKLEPPDMESFSKAISAGQYPLSVLALSKHAADTYKVGVYGNTMTSNPRALDVASFVLDQINQNLRNNICKIGQYFKDELFKLKDQFPEVITKVQGTGLLLACEINNKFSVTTSDGLEQKIRQAGVNVIHGGENALRFTPSFNINKTQIDFVLSLMKSVFCKLN